MKTTIPEQRLMSSKCHKIKLISIHATVDDVNFCDGLECIYVKYKSHASTASELPD